MNIRIQLTQIKKYCRKAELKILSNMILFLFSASLMIVFSSCSVGLPTEEEQTNKDLFIDMESFSVSYPPGDDWSCKTDKIKKMITFARVKRWLTGNIAGGTVINIFQEQITSDTFKMGEKETAEDYRKKQLNIMKEEGVKKGQYELEDVSMSDTVVNRKKFFCMFYKTSSGSFWEGDDYVTESILAVYLPPDYLEKRFFYVFIISDSKRAGSLIGQDAGQLYPVLKSFEMKQKI